MIVGSAATVCAPVAAGVVHQDDRAPGAAPSSVRCTITFRRPASSQSSVSTDQSTISMCIWRQQGETWSD